MERRAHRRIPANLKVGFNCNNVHYHGTVVNISDNSMLVITGGMCFPFDAKFKMIFPLQLERLNISVQVSRLLRRGDIYVGIAVEIINPPTQYISFLNTLKSAL
jgi:hypothetical protein